MRLENRCPKITEKITGQGTAVVARDGCPRWRDPNQPNESSVSLKKIRTGWIARVMPPMTGRHRRNRSTSTSQSADRTTQTRRYWVISSESSRHSGNISARNVSECFASLWSINIIPSDRCVEALSPRASFSEYVNRSVRQHTATVVYRMLSTNCDLVIFPFLRLGLTVENRRSS